MRAVLVLQMDNGEVMVMDINFSNLTAEVENRFGDMIRPMQQITLSDAYVAHSTRYPAGGGSTNAIWQDVIEAADIPEGAR